MLPKQYRLTGKQTFAEVKTRGKIFQSDNFGLLVLPTQAKEPSRFGFIVSTKISKKAVERNRIKRILRAAVSPLLIEVSPGNKIVFLAKKTLLNEPSDLEAEVVNAFRAAKIIV